MHITESMEFFIELSYLLSAAGFFVSLKLLSSPKSARLGNAFGMMAMALAILTTLIAYRPSQFLYIMLFMAIGAGIGVLTARTVKMTAMPQMVAILNGLGGAASVLVAFSEAFRLIDFIDLNSSIIFSLASWLSVVIGAITLSGSIIAFLKLQGLMSSRPIIFLGQRVLLIGFFAITLLFAYLFFTQSINPYYFYGLAFIAFAIGIILVIPIGGADMPVVISLLNSYSGCAALFAGFVVQSNLLIISGALVGASGIILTRLMCKAMNRSLMNVVFGAFKIVDKVSSIDEKPMKEFMPIDASMLLANARKVIIVPGYGLAVSQAQNNLRELGNALKERGVKVCYAIHPVAGRMPGHMNVLLAEADVPYDELYDLDAINTEFQSADVSLVIGANDVVNPKARSDKESPLFGMPILNVDESRSIIVMKRGKGLGFAGVSNPLFTLDKTGVVFGDAKASLTKVLNSLKDL